MRYLALASDYDGTLAHDGAVDEETISALKRLVNSGRKLILVTGRELPELQSIFPRLDLCERVVAENGAVLYNPATREKRALADGPPPSFLDSLRSRGVEDLSVGDVIVATWHPYEQAVLEAIRQSGLALQIIFNKEAVMILPSGVNKMTGLCAALAELAISPHNVVGIGDAENDHAFVEQCECAVAVANAIPALKDTADFVTAGARGEGVREIIDKLVNDDAAGLNLKARRRIVLGEAADAEANSSDDNEISLPAYGRNLLICGQSGSGKSTLSIALLESLAMLDYQVCLVDPEGDYENLSGFRTVGDSKRAPSIEHVAQVLEDPQTQVIANLVAVNIADRPTYFASLVTELQDQRVLKGRPHWLCIDEAHHVLPSEWAFTSATLPEELSNLTLITVHPEHVSAAALRRINTVLLVGPQPETLLEAFTKAVGWSAPALPERKLEAGEVLVWMMEEQSLRIMKPRLPRSEHFRHRRKYAEGELEPERVFHFRGPDNKLDLRAQNLNIFVQIAEGIDRETWIFHLYRGDYSNWVKIALKDSDLANEIEAVEKDQALDDGQSRSRIKDAILQRYTAPA